ncbi:MAG: restriction endonuclease subunit S [Rhizobiaceae bacterium]|nr:restriction endonuclease subunit S [Rhizobiaceae bacterium]
MNLPAVALGELCDIQIGRTPSRSVKEYWQEGVHPWVSISDLRERIVSATKERITDIGVRGSGSRLIKAGTVLMSFKLSIGKLAFAGCDLYTNEAIAALSPRDERLTPSFLLRALEQINFDGQGNRAVMGMTLNKASLAALPVPLPSLDEQKRIVAILDKADQLRQKRRQAIALLDSLTQSIFLEIFGDPVSNPKGWPVRPFGSLVENCDSKRVPVKQSDRDKRPGTYPYYGSVGVIDDIDGFLFDGEHLLVSEDGKHLQSRTRPIACIAKGRFWVNNHAHVVKSNGLSDLFFLREFLEISPIDKYISGIDQIKLNRKSMDNIAVPLPPMHLQEMYRSVTTRLEIQRQRADQMGARLDSLFSSLQHRAFAGQL